MKRRPSIDLDGVFGALGTVAETDELDDQLLDAAEELLRTSGLRRWSLDDVTTHANVGRSSIYRRFGSRDNLVHAVLARELQQTFAAMWAAAEARDALEDKAVATVIAALEALDDSVVEALLSSDPDTFLPFLTTDAGPLLAMARESIIALVAPVAPEPSPELAEAVARFALSFILTRDTILPLDDPTALDQSVRRMLRPFLTALGLPTTEKRHT